MCPAAGRNGRIYGTERISKKDRPIKGRIGKSFYEPAANARRSRAEDSAGRRLAPGP